MKLGRSALLGSLLVLSVQGFAQEPATAIDQARKVLREGADSKDPTDRVQAIKAAGLIGPSEELRTKLEKFLTDGNVDVRVAAVGALADHKSTDSIPALEKVLKGDKVPEVQFAAAKALYALNDPQGRAWLIDVYNGSQKASSSTVSSQSRKIRSNFHSFTSAGMFIVTQGIGYVPVPGVGEGFSAANDLLSDPELSPRAASLLLLAKEKSDQTDDLLREALKDKDWSVRASAAQMIAYTARTGLSEDLVPLFTDKKDKVRFRAAGAYLHLASLEKNPKTPAGN